MPVRREMRGGTNGGSPAALERSKHIHPNNNPTSGLQDRSGGKARIHSIGPTTRSQHVASSKGLQGQRAWECGGGTDACSPRRRRYFFFLNEW